MTPIDKAIAAKLTELKEPFRKKYWEAFFNGARHDEMLDQAWPWLVDQVLALTELKALKESAGEQIRSVIGETVKEMAPKLEQDLTDAYKRGCEDTVKSLNERGLLQKPTQSGWQDILKIQCESITFDRDINLNGHDIKAGTTIYFSPTPPNTGEGDA